LEFGCATEILGPSDRPSHSDQLLAREVTDLEAGHGGHGLAAGNEISDGQAAPGQCRGAAVTPSKTDQERLLVIL
jgi:hypothetical protein